MANRYWIGGTGDWDSTDHWSTSSGGSSGASVPTSSDNVFIDSNSGFTTGPQTEMLTNGTFTGNADGWLLGTGWTYGDNKVTHTPGNTADLETDTGSYPFTLTGDNAYKVSLNIGGTKGCVTVNLADVWSRKYVAGSGNVTFTQIAIGAGGAIYITPSNDFDGTIDSVSVTDVTGGVINEVTTTAVECNDFTSTTGGNYYIKYIDSDINIYGDAVLESGLTWSQKDGSYTIFNGTNPQSLTSNGSNLYHIEKDGSSDLTFNDDVDVGSIILEGSSGTIYFGDNTFTLWFDNYDVLANYGDDTIDPGTSTIKMTASDFPYIDLGGGTLYKLWIIGDGLQIYGSNEFNEIKIETGITVYFEELETQTVDKFTAVGSVNNIITIDTIEQAVDQFILEKTSGAVICDYLNLNNSNATGGALWYAGSNSADTTNNDGWIFEDFPTPEYDPLSLVLEVPSTTASYQSLQEVSYDPISIILSIPNTTSTYEAYYDTTYNPLSIILTIPNFTSRYTLGNVQSSYNPLSIILTIPNFTSRYTLGNVQSSYNPVSLLLDVPSLQPTYKAWLRQDKNISTWVNQNKDSSVFSNQSKNSSVWSNQTKNI